MGFNISKSARCGVIGYGSWATALVKILLENEQAVSWHIKNRQVSEHILTHHTNPKYLSSVHFDTDRLRITDDIDRVVEESDVLVLAVPSAFLKNTLEDLSVSLADKFVVSAIKGIVPEENITVAEFLNLSYCLPYAQIGILTGPCHAEEVALERLSYLTLCCKTEENAAVLADKFRTDYIRVSTSTDIYGTEYAAVLKNIYAIAVGMAHGVGYGDNFLAVLISNSVIEMARFLQETFPCDRDVNTSAYLGDLLVTAYSQFSRNRTFGMMIGKGYSVKTTQIEMNMVAEGYYASKCINEINRKYGISMPIADAVHAILYEKKSPTVEIASLTSLLK